MKVAPLDLRREDIRDLSRGQDIERLFRQLNTFGASAGQAFKELTFGDNMLAFVKEVEFELGMEAHTISLDSPMTATDAACIAWKSDSALVTMEGRVTKNTATSGATVTTLPREFWPHRNLYFSVPTSLVTAGFIAVSSAGVMTVQFTGAPTWFALDPVTYVAADHRPYPNPSFPIMFRNELAGKAKPLGIWPWQTFDISSKEPTPVESGNIAWTLSSKGDQIVLTDVANLPHERKYRMRIVVVAG